MSWRANDRETHTLYINEVIAPGASGRIGINFFPGKKGEGLTGPN